MVWTYSSKKLGATFTATCNTNFFFITGSSGSYTLTTATTKVGTCVSPQQGQTEYWKFSDGSKDDVGDCACSNIF